MYIYGLVFMIDYVLKTRVAWTGYLPYIGRLFIIYNIGKYPIVTLIN